MTEYGWSRRRPLIALGGLLPLIAFIAVLIGQIRELQYSAMEAQLATRTEAAASALEVYLSNQLGVLAAAAGARALDHGDLASFRHTMTRLAANQPGWYTVILTDHRAQLINTRVADGAPLPPVAEPESLARAWTTGRPTVGDLVNRMVALRQPVIRDGVVRYVLTAVIDPSAITAVLAAEHLPSQWGAQAFDAKGLVVARSSAANWRVGQAGSPAFHRAREAGGKIVRAVIAQGTDSFLAASRVRDTDWHVAVAAAAAVVAAPYRHIMWTLYAGGAIALAATVAVLVLLALHARRNTFALEARARSAESASQEKSAFLASMSHEMRTPLNAVIGFAEVMDSRLFGPLGNSKYAEYIRDILSSGRHLLSLINDLLDLSKIEAGKMELDRSQVAVEQVVHAGVALVREAAGAKAIDIQLDLQPGISVFADERLLRQMLVNLLSNAVKYTPGGTIRVRATQDSDTRIVISDTGVGMDADELQHALEPYVRVNSTMTREQVGTGLGLALTKRLAELHSGALQLESVLGVGTTATIVLPHRQAQVLTLARAA